MLSRPNEAQNRPGSLVRLGAGPCVLEPARVARVCVLHLALQEGPALGAPLVLLHLVVLEFEEYRRACTRER